MVEGLERFAPGRRAENEASPVAPVLDLYAEFVPDSATPEEVDDDVIGLPVCEMISPG